MAKRLCLLEKMKGVSRMTNQEKYELKQEMIEHVEDGRDVKFVVDYYKGIWADTTIRRYFKVAQEIVRERKQ